LTEQAPETVPTLEARVAKQKRIEGRNFYWPKFWVILAVCIMAILVAIFRGGARGIKSVIGVARCTGVDWGIFAIYVVLLSCLPFYSYWIIMREQKEKKAIGWNLDTRKSSSTASRL